MKIVWKTFQQFNIYSTDIMSFNEIKCNERFFRLCLRDCVSAVYGYILTFIDVFMILLTIAMCNISV